MNDVVLVGIAVLALFGVVYLLYRRFAFPRGGDAARGGELVPSTPRPVTLEGDQVRPRTGAFSCRELVEAPVGAISLRQNPEAVARGQQITAELLKAGTALPGKTIEVVFDPKVAAGLKEGALELVPSKAGGTFLETRDVVSKRFAGKGRLVDGGRMRQLAAGAFQLLSIAVAQAHLADINRGINEVKDGVKSVLDWLDNDEKAEIESILGYLSHLLRYMQELSPGDQVPQEKRTVFEMTVRSALKLSSKLANDAETLKQRVYAVDDADTVGSGHTYAKLAGLKESFERLILKHGLLLRMMAMLEVGAGYLDPGGATALTEASASEERYEAAIKEVCAGLRDQANRHLFKAIFNKEDTLKLRRETIISGGQALLLTASQDRISYQSLTGRLQELWDRSRHDGRVSLALKFDDRGEVEDVLV